MPRRLAFGLALLISATGPLAAGEFGCPCCGFDGTCVLKVEPGTEKKTCYEVECKEVCIPPVRFPWQACRPPRCGKVRVVARLKEEKKEEPICKYEWQVVCPRCGRPVAKKEDAKEKGKVKAGAKKGGGSAPPAPMPAPAPMPVDRGEIRGGGQGAENPPSPPMPPVPPASPIGRSSTR